MSLNGIVTVNITRQNSSVDTAGFGKAAIFAYHNQHAERVLEFNDAASMLQANGGPFLATDLTYIMAQSLFAQSPRPSSVLSVRRMFPTTRTVELTPISGTIAGQVYPLNTTDYVVEIGDETFTYTTDATATVAEITAGLTTLINAGTQNVLATDNTTSITLESAASPGGAATPGASFSLCYNLKLMASVDNTPVAAGGSIADEIAAAIDEDDSFYGVVGDWFGATEILAASAAVEAMDRYHIASSANDDIHDQSVTTDIASLVQAAGYNNSLVFHSKTPEIAASGYMGRILPTIPGSATHKFKSIAGLAVGDYTQTQISAMQGKNATFYIRRLGRNITCDGKSASGEWIDVVRFVHWLKARLCEAVFSLKVSRDKIPFTNQGIGLIENAVRGVLSTGIANGGLAADPPPVVTVPDARVNVENGVNVIDKANRFLNYVDFCATLQGAIHDTLIQGKVID